MRCALPLLLTLAGCSAQAPAGNQAIVANVATAVAGEDDAIPPAPAGDAMSPPPRSAATPAKTLPAALVGVWTADKDGKCAAGNPLRIEIAPDRIVFHESVARIESAVATWPEGYGVDAVVTGEGTSERRSFDLIPRPDGTLTRSEAPYPDVVYRRCGAPGSGSSIPENSPPAAQ